MYKKFLTSTVIVLGLCGATHSAAANTLYPSKPITMILSSGAGAGSDLIARYLSSKMTPLLGQSFVIDNRPGANGIIAMSAVSRAAPDGYTLTLGASSSHVLNPVLYDDLPYDAIEGFTAIGQIGTVSILMVANHSFPANNLSEFLKFAKEQNPPVQYASYGIGSTGHFCGELLRQFGEVELEHIPYKSVPPILTDMIGGIIGVGFTDMTSGSAAVKAGQVKAITSCTSRTPSLPDVAAYTDHGIDFDREFRWVLYGPADLPEAVVQKLSNVLNQVLAMPDVVDKMKGFGITVHPLNGAELDSLNASDIDEWRAIAKKSDIRMN